MEDLKDRTKKPYLPPEMYRVRLDAEQAVLGACSSFNAGPKDGDLLGTACVDGGCKQKSHGPGDSGPSS